MGAARETVADSLGLGPVVSYQQHAKKERGLQAFTLDDVELASDVLKVPISALIDEGPAPPVPSPASTMTLADISAEEQAMIHTWRAAGRKAAALYLIAPLKDG